MIVRLKCPVHGIVREFNYDITHIGDPLKGIKYCQHCGLLLVEETEQPPVVAWYGKAPMFECPFIPNDSVENPDDWSWSKDGEG